MTKQNKGRKLFAVSASAALVASAIVPVASAASVEDFNDKGQISGYALPFVTALVEADVMTGKTGGNFDPKGNLTRAEAAVMFTKAFGLEADGTNSFKDLKAGAWYEDFVLAVADNDIVVGFQDGTFGPNNNITRAQAAVMIVKSLDQIAVSNPDLSQFEDGDAVPAWAAGYVAKAVDLGIIKGREAGGKLYLDYAKEITRQDFAVMFQKTGVEAGLWNAIGEETTVETKIVSATATNKTTVVVELSTAVDEVKAENFTIEGATVEAATLADNKKTVTLTVAGLDYGKEYTVAAKDIAVDGEATDFGTSKFNAPAVQDLWTLSIETAKASLLADGADNTVVTFKLLDAAGQVDTNADNIVLDLNTTYGTLSSKRVTIQDGVATIILTSEFSNTGVTAKIDAQIIEASGDYKDLIGKVVGTTSVAFVTSTVDNVETITLVSAEANQADRFTLFFDKAASLKHFVATDATTGELLYQYYNGTAWVTNVTADDIPTSVNAKDIRHQLKLTGADKTISITQGSKTFTVKGFKPVAGNEKAVEVILEKDVVLTDNASVDVVVNTVNSLDKVTKSSTDFKVTDARVPEATSVSVEGLKTLKVKFSESIDDANFVLDGRFVKDTHFTVNYGEFDPRTLADTRDIATLRLTDNYKETADATSIAGYFKAGTHTVQVANTLDFAARTDSANKGTTQNLNFTIAADTAKPTATVSVESPEQFRVKFDKYTTLVAYNADETIDQATTKSNLLAALDLQILDTNGKYVSVTKANDTLIKGLNLATLLDVTAIDSTEFVLELTSDWTTLYSTSTSNKNYYNDKFQLVILDKKVTNAANGLTNDEINLDLSTANSPLTTPDVTSPTIDTITRLSATSNFDVTLSEPVKLAGALDEKPTLAQGQGSLPVTTVQFIGKDKDGATVTFDGTVLGYSSADTNATDKVLRVTWNAVAGKTPQTVVDAGGNANWTLVVRSISDDVGNTVASATKEFTIAKSPSTITPFRVVTAEATDLASDTTKDTIELTFTEGVKTSGTNASTNPANYTVNGKTLPVGTSISVANADGTTTPDANGFEKLIITLPEGSLNSGAGKSNIITINKALESYDGSIISGATEIVLYSAENDTATSVSDALAAATTALANARTALAAAQASGDEAAIATAQQQVQTALTAAQAALAAAQNAGDQAAIDKAQELLDDAQEIEETVDGLLVPEVKNVSLTIGDKERVAYDEATKTFTLSLIGNETADQLKSVTGTLTSDASVVVKNEEGTVVAEAEVTTNDFSEITDIVFDKVTLEELVNGREFTIELSNGTDTSVYTLKTQAIEFTVGEVGLKVDEIVAEQFTVTVLDPSVLAQYGLQISGLYIQNGEEEVEFVEETIDGETVYTASLSAASKDAVEALKLYVAN